MLLKMRLLPLTIGLQPVQSLEICRWPLCNESLLNTDVLVLRETLALPSGEGVKEGSTVLNVVEAFVFCSLAAFLEGYEGG
jgi:hypothetical protein